MGPKIWSLALSNIKKFRGARNISTKDKVLEAR